MKREAVTFARLEMRFPLDRRPLKKAMGFCGAVSLSRLFFRLAPWASFVYTRPIDNHPPSSKCKIGQQASAGRKGKKKSSMAPAVTRVCVFKNVIILFRLESNMTITKPWNGINYFALLDLTSGLNFVLRFRRPLFACFLFLFFLHWWTGSLSSFEFRLKRRIIGSYSLFLR